VRVFRVRKAFREQEEQMELLEHQVAQVRKASANPAIKIMLGGPLMQDCPELVHALRADFSAQTADEAVRLAEQWTVAG
jgi:hypothetical protein